MHLLVDLDNCIAEDHWRLHLIGWQCTDLNERFRAYHQAALYDPAHHTALLRMATRVHIITARPIEYAALTVEWLDKHRIKFHTLLMRPIGDHRPSVALKEELLFSVPRPIDWAVDDRPDVVAMYRKRGLAASILAIHPIEWKENADGRG